MPFIIDPRKKIRIEILSLKVELCLHRAKQMFGFYDKAEINKIEKLIKELENRLASMPPWMI